MIHHVSLGVSDLARATAFYDAVLAPLGYRRTFEVDGEKFPEFWIGGPRDRSRPGSAGNGTHVAFSAPSSEAVAQFHAAALTSGGTDDGAPGPRPEYGPDYHGAFVRDPDGNKIEACLNQSG